MKIFFVCVLRGITEFISLVIYYKCSARRYFIIAGRTHFDPFLQIGKSVKKTKNTNKKP